MVLDSEHTEPTEEQPSDSQPSDEQPSDSQPSDEQPSEENPSVKEPQAEPASEPESQTETEEEGSVAVAAAPVEYPEEDENLICSLCRNPITIDQEYVNAAYGPVHEEPCSHQTKRV